MTLEKNTNDCPARDDHGDDGRSTTTEYESAHTGSKTTMVEPIIVISKQEFLALACLVHCHRAVLPEVDSQLKKKLSDATLSSSDSIGDTNNNEDIEFAIQEHRDALVSYEKASGLGAAASTMEKILEERRLNLLALQSDLEIAEQTEEEKHKLAEKLLTTVGTLLRDADRELTSLQDNNLLGSAIVRGCQELADLVSTVAENVGHDQLMLAEASLQDFSDSSDVTDLRLQPELDNNHGLIRSSSRSATTSHHKELAIVVDLLRDVEFSLRSIDEAEANEIADLAVSVALVFVQSLQIAHSKLTPRDLLPSTSPYNGASRIELLENPVFDEENPPSPAPVIQHAVRPTPRVRCLWPPLSPMATDFLQWTKEELIHRQHWAVSTAVAVTLWPVALTAAMWSVPALAVDHVLQQTYGHFDQSPVIVGAEVGAAQLQQTAKLSVKTAVALAKPTLIVVRRQVQKHGPGLMATVQEKAHHPISTIHEAFDGTLWCAGQIFHFCGDQWHRWRQDTVASESLL
jgi:hypothetical protein